MTLPQLTELLGWASTINIAYLLLATLAVTLMSNSMTSIHSKLFKLEEEKLKTRYFDFLSHYKIVTLAFFVAPYLALKVMGH